MSRRSRRSPRLRAGPSAGSSPRSCVIDGRPRYHLAGCLHLLGRTVERLPAIEAVELGFTPCGQCEPVTGLLAERS